MRIKNASEMVFKRLERKVRQSGRIQDYDYSQSGFYFVTICSKKHQHFFGEIVGGQMVLNDIGIIVESSLKNIGNIYSDISLDEYIIMPNHIHAIIVINDGANVGTEHCSVQLEAKDCSDTPTLTAQCAVTTITKKVCLSQVIKSYKGFCTKTIKNKSSKNFAWQRSFYDHVIRNEVSLFKIREYIQNNPVKWELDEYNYEALVNDK